MYKTTNIMWFSHGARLFLEGLRLTNVKRKDWIARVTYWGLLVVVVDLTIWAMRSFVVKQMIVEVIVNRQVNLQILPRKKDH